MTNSNIFKEQNDLEQEMVTLGIKRYREETRNAATNKHESTTPAGIQFIRKSIRHIETRLNELRNSYVNGEPLSYSSDVVGKLFDVPLDVVAYLAIKGCVNHLTTPCLLTKVSLEIGGFIEDESRFRFFKLHNRNLFNVVLNDAQRKTTNYRRLRRTLVHTELKNNIPWEPWGTRMKVRMGQMLVEIVCQATGIMEIVKHSTTTFQQRKTPYFLQATTKSLEWIDKKNSVCELLSPVKLPTVIPPKPWTGVFDGGYYTIEMPLVKTFDQGYLNELNKVEMPQVYNSINLVQNTRWRINKKVFKILDHLYSNETSCKVIPEFLELSIAEPFPENGSKEEMIQWKRRASQIHAENVRRKTKRLQCSQLIWTARKFKDYPSIYFPHTLDFRGRMYAHTAFLNPQGNDMARGLLEFADGKALGSTGLDWLKIYVANCWGMDKLPLDERYQWTEDNMDWIIENAREPLDTFIWMEADKPWQFLAAIIDLEQGNHVSHLPCTVDGSCNGLQHFSAMLRDEKGGAAVNLVENDTPADLYAIVAEEAQQMVNMDTENEIAECWKGDRVSRALVKRPVMTTPYGATLYGMRDQLSEEITKQIEKGNITHLSKGDDIFPHCQYLAKVIYDSIGHIMWSAREGMTFLQNVAKQMSKESRCIVWNLPTGFKVKQDYRKSVIQKVKTQINGRMATLFAKSGDSDKLNTIKQSNGIAPNFVHSLDAAHLMMTINEANQRFKISSFAVVHDSFGTHACDVESLGACLRKTFVQLYSEDVLKKFRNEQKVLTVLPKKGKLDLNEVLNAEFFFS